MSLSIERKKARVFMLKHAAAWLDDLVSTELCEDENGNWDEAK